MYSTWHSERGVIVGVANDSIEDISEDIVFATSKPLTDKSRVITKEYILDYATWAKSSHEYKITNLKEVSNIWFDRDIISKFLYHAKLSEDGITQYIRLIEYKKEVSDMVN